MTQVEMRNLIIHVVEAATDQFEHVNPARLAQLENVADSALMAIDALYTETPYRF